MARFKFKGTQVVDNTAGKIAVILKHSSRWILICVVIVFPWDGAAGFAKPIDVFLIAGQSNAVGAIDTPDTRPRVPPRIGWQYVMGQIYDLAQHNARGAWPQFTMTYFARTKRIVGLVPTAVGGTGQTVAADVGRGNWAAGGTLWARSVSTLQDAIKAFEDAGFTPSFRGILWSQGETDATKINGRKIEAADYRRELVEMIAKYRSVFGRDMPFYIFQTGRWVDAPEVGFAQIRDVQRSVAEGDPRTFIVFSAAAGFPSRGMMGHTRIGAPSPVHYSQAGYNQMGRDGAETVVCLMFNSKARC